MSLLSMEKIRSNAEYCFPPVSDKLHEGYEENYLWTAKYIRFRKHNQPLSSEDIALKLSSFEQPSSNVAHRFRGALLGLAICDALGATNEFKQPGSFDPINDMVGGGPFALKPGQWTDDTSMAYAMGQSLLFRKGFDALDQMTKYLAWRDFGVFSCTGTCFDIGSTVNEALEGFLETKNPFAGPTASDKAGNGSLMRLAPVVLYYFDNLKDAIYFAGKSSETTHGATEAVDSCRFFASLIYGAITGQSKPSLLKSYTPYENAWEECPLTEKVFRIRSGEFLGKGIQQLRPTGYVIDTLEAALWCFAKTETFREGALLAANLGGDSDTIGAVYGQIAGAYYGEPEIPAEWLQKLSHQHIFFIQAHKMMQNSGVV